MIIDFHTHTFPDAIAASAIAKMQLDCHSKAFSGGTVDDLRATAAEAGIDISVVQPVATRPKQVRSVNELAIAMNGKEGLAYFGCIHPDFGDYESELERLAAAGIKGVKVHPVYQGAEIDDPRYLRIFECCAEKGLWVLTHGGDDIGFPGLVRCSPEMCRSAIRQVPGLKMVVAHMGGWRNWERVADCLADTEAVLDTAFSLGSIVPLGDGYYEGKDISLLSDEMFCHMVKIFGAERILFATDSPWTDRKAEVEHILSMPLSASDKAAILGGNAEKILFG